MKVNLENEKLKKKYFRRLKEAEGYSENTISTVERAIYTFEDYTENSSFKSFCERQAVGYKKWLENKKFKGQSISNVTKYHYLRHLQTFLKWLSYQPGYKSKITLDAISYLTLDKKSVREALAVRERKFPSLDYVRKLTASIKVSNEIDQRDRALISFLLLSGMRYRAICSLSLACVDIKNLKIYQDPRLGVKTKASKVITTILFRFDDALLNYILQWIEYLQKNKGFQPTDPLFPRNKVSQVEGGLSFICNEVEPGFWSGGNSIREILKRRSSEACLEYYKPHSFRHAAVHIVSRYCNTFDQMKAVSQNLGHKFILTTLETYGRLDDSRVEEALADIDFSVDPHQQTGNVPAEALERFLKKYKK